MPTLEDYIGESEQYDEAALALVPEDLRDQINAQLDAATSSEESETEPVEAT